MALSKNIHEKSLATSALDIQTISSDTTTVGNAIDTIGYESLEFVVLPGTITDGTYTVQAFEDDDVDFENETEVSSEEQLGTISFDNTNSDTAKRFGVVGKKRYFRIKIVSTGTSSGGTFSAVAISSDAWHQPVADDT